MKPKEKELLNTNETIKTIANYIELLKQQKKAISNELKSEKLTQLVRAKYNKKLFFIDVEIEAKQGFLTEYKQRVVKQ